MITVKLCVDSSVSYSFLPNGTTDVKTLNRGLLCVALTYHAWWLYWPVAHTFLHCLVIIFGGCESVFSRKHPARRRSPLAASTWLWLTEAGWGKWFMFTCTRWFFSNCHGKRKIKPAVCLYVTVSCFCRFAGMILEASKSAEVWEMHTAPTNSKWLKEQIPSEPDVHSVNISYYTD